MGSWRRRTDRGEMEDLERLAKLIKQKSLTDAEIARLIGRPAERSHAGEYIAANVFDITLEHSASQKGMDGRFAAGSLGKKSVNIKWYGIMDGLSDISPNPQPDFYLVMTGPKVPSGPSRGAVRPWTISRVYLFDAVRLIAELQRVGVRIGVATSVRSHLWEMAEIYPEQRNAMLLLSEEQERLLDLFH